MDFYVTIHYHNLFTPRIIDRSTSPLIGRPSDPHVHVVCCRRQTVHTLTRVSPWKDLEAFYDSNLSTTTTTTTI